MIAEDLKAKWVAALRSGEYRQGVGQLKNGDRFCCLGVFCQVAGIPLSPNGKSALPENDDDCSYDRLYRLGVDITWTSRLWNMNDSGASFHDIADYIEEHMSSAVNPSVGEESK